SPWPLVATLKPKRYKILAEMARLSSNQVSRNQLNLTDHEIGLWLPSVSRDCPPGRHFTLAGMGADRTHGQRWVRVWYRQWLERFRRGRRLFRRQFGAFRNLLLMAG